MKTQVLALLATTTITAQSFALDTMPWPNTPTVPFCIDVPAPNPGPNPPTSTTSGNGVKVGTATPTQPFQPKVVYPKDIQRMLEEIKRKISDDELERLIGRNGVESLKDYAALRDDQILANAYVAAAAAGAAAAVVEFVWDKYVGNGGKNKLIIPQGYFDVHGGYPNQTLPAAYAQAVQHYGRNPIPGPRGGMFPPGTNPQAMTPAAVGTAVAGAVAYKAVEYSLNKFVGGSRQFDPTNNFNPRQFDLQQNRLQ